MVGRRGFFLLPPLLSFFFVLKFAEGGAQGRLRGNHGSRGEGGLSPTRPTTRSTTVQKYRTSSLLTVGHLNHIPRHPSGTWYMSCIKLPFLMIKLYYFISLIVIIRCFQLTGVVRLLDTLCWVKCPPDQSARRNSDNLLLIEVSRWLQ